MKNHKISTVARQLKASAKTNSTRTASPLSSAALEDVADGKVSVSEHRTRTLSPEELEQAAAELRDQVEALRPELLPLLGPLPISGRLWNLQQSSDAVAYSALLQDRLLCLPELNRNSPCYSARDLVLLYTKLKYLETFSQAELAGYANAVAPASPSAVVEAAPIVRVRQEEVRVVRQLATVANTTELFSRLAALLHIPCHGDAWNEIIKFAANALPFAEQTESLLVRGSDDRSTLCPLTKRNSYNASTIPFSTDVARGSCTCSSISLKAFEHAERLRQQLLLNSLSINPNAQSSSEFFTTKMRIARTRLATCLGVSDMIRADQLRILLSPSGTDAELWATVAALARLYSGLGEEENLPVECHSEVAFPLGLEDYFSRYDIPEDMRHVRERLGTNMNVGLLLRWETAFVNMEPFCKIPPANVSTICKLYMGTCRTKMQDSWSHMVELLNPPEPTESDSSSTVTPIDTIVAFKVFDKNGGFLDMLALKALHTLLAKDLSDALPDDALAKKRCLLGQPVSLGKSGAVLRIAMGADMFNEVYARGKGESGFAAAMEPLVEDDNAILLKIALILRHWETLHHQYIEECVEPTTLEPLKPLSDWNFSVKDAQVASVVRQMQQDGILGGDDEEEESKLAVVYDLDAIDMAFQALLTSFPAHFDHRFAMKSCPLAFFVKRAIENDVGLECASIVEVKHALRLGCPPHRIVFDSPCKTRRDLKFAINAGVEVNADNFEELDIIREHAEAIFQSSFPECTPRYAGNLPRVGLRINPLLGAGTNACLSVSTVQSKFGVPLTPENRARIIAFFCANPWMTGLHAHVGSQGCSLEMLSQGAVVLSELANQIDAAAGTSRIKVLNIGGGLSTNFDGEDVSPTFAEYVDVLRHEAPQLFERTGRLILTEFGSSVSSKTGWTISEVECVKAHPPVDGDNLQQTAIIHAGSDLFLRTCYRPDLFERRLSVYNSAGLASMAPLAVQNVAGPLCFGGDLVGRRVELPTISRGDFVVVHDTGANTMSMFSRHCSRPAPAVYGYRTDEEGEISLELLKPAESPEEVMSFWG
ncbi:hypothetical protein PHYBOEH_000010 [Phytophthora boehmeriae]|uniref:Diaminopimelate decarboxylase n=1 Tax=Phytophthora boehmeriae TaxID=109152 RepID=A0A8T1X7Y7_9STRA|nr:hypothetical protein PHYBOEH_000010 [Phytophthora boehmeriae]